MRLMSQGVRALAFLCYGGSFLARPFMSVREIFDWDILVDDYGVNLRFDALVEDVVVVSAATRWDPEQWGAARCKGSLLLEEDELPPSPDAPDDELRAIAEGVEVWDPIDA